MLKKITLLLVTLSLIYACSSSSSENEPIITDNFDRGAMLTHLADNLIIPSFQDFSTKMLALKTAGETFTTTPNQINLDGLRTAWYNAYKI